MSFRTADHRSSLRRLCAGLVLCGAALLPFAPQPAHGEVASEARTPGEIYERKKHLGEIVRYVAKDLKARWEADKEQPPAELLLVIDPTTSQRPVS